MATTPGGEHLILVHDWNLVVLNAIRNLGKLPLWSPGRERGGSASGGQVLAVIYSGVYDAWAAYDDVAKPAHSNVAADVQRCRAGGR